MNIDIHRVTEIKLESIRVNDDYTTRTIVIKSEDGDIEINLYSVRNSEENTLEIKA
jgi:hypothetical protein